MENPWSKENTTEKIPIRVGRKAPDFSLKNEKDEIWSLSGQRGKVTVLLFYPENETLVCTRQMCSVRDNWERYLETKASIVGVSSATAAEHEKFGKKYRLPFPLLADEDRKITKLFSEHWLFPIQMIRAVIVIDANRIVRHRTSMLRVFRPLDSEILRTIHEARGDALFETYEKMRKSFWKEKRL